MAIKESLLTVVNSIGDSDFVRAVTSAGASRKLSVSNLAKHIVETYNGSTIAGSAQSVKSAVESVKTLADSKTANFYFVYPAGTAPLALMQNGLADGKIPYNQVFTARISAGYYFFAFGHFYQVSGKIYGSAIVGRPNYMCKVNCNADAWTETAI